MSTAYEQLARSHDLGDEDGVRLGPATPLLAKSGEGRLSPAFRGRLPGGAEGIVGRLEYSGGRYVGAAAEGGSYRFHVGVVEVPESRAFAPRVFCERRGRVIDQAHHGFSLDDEALWTESEALSARYQVTTGPYQEQNWMRQLFAPTFIDWLATEPPEDFSFELAYGWLVCSVEDDAPDLEGLTRLCEATSHVARRIREESLE